MSKEFLETEDQMVLRLFRKFNLTSPLNSVDDILARDNLREVLERIDSNFFNASKLHKLDKLASFAPLMEEYGTDVLDYKPSIKTMKSLMRGQRQSWVSILLYLFGKCPSKNQFIAHITQCDIETQQYLMILMSGALDPDEAVNTDTDSKIKVIGSLQDQLHQKQEEIKDRDLQIQKLKAENSLLRTRNGQLEASLQQLYQERSHHLESVHVSNMDDLMEVYKRTLDNNEKLVEELYRMQTQKEELDQKCLSLVHELDASKADNFHKSPALKTRESSPNTLSPGIYFTPGSDSDRQTPNRKSIQAHTRHLEYNIQALYRHNNNLQSQIGILHRHFMSFAQDIKSIRQDGSFKELQPPVF